MGINLYSAGFDFARLGLTGTGAVFSGACVGTVAPTTGLYLQGGVITTGAVTIDGQALLSFKAYCEGIVTNCGFSFSPQSLTWYIYNITGTNFAIDWNSAGTLGAELMAIFGFTANCSGAASYTSTIRPKYIIKPVIPNQSNVHKAYEPSGRVNYVESDGGQAYSTYPAEIPTYEDWIQPFESDPGPTSSEWTADHSVAGAPVHRLTVPATDGVWWTWEDFYKHVRAHMPIHCIDSVDAYNSDTIGWIYKMRGEQAHWDPTRVSADFDGHWNMPFKCRKIVYGEAG
jgi:hypothetical protein